MPRRQFEAQSQAEVRVVGWIYNVEYAGVWMALESSYFKEEGLDMKTLPGEARARRRPRSRWPRAGREIGYRHVVAYLDAVNRGNDFVLVAGTRFGNRRSASVAAVSRSSKAAIVGKKILARRPQRAPRSTRP